MKFKSLFIFLLSMAMIVVVYDADAQRRNKYKKRRQTNKKVSKYRGGSRGVGRFEPYIFVGGSLNAGNYFGDLAPVSKTASTDVSFTRPGLGGYIGYKFHHSLAVRAGVNWVRVVGDDFAADPGSEDSRARYARNLSFRNDIKEFQLGLEVYLFPNYGGPNARLPFNAYLFVGGAVFHHEPRGLVPDADYQTALDGSVAAPSAGEWVKLRPLETEGESYSNIAFSIPVSVGAQIRLPGTPFMAGIEFGIRYMFTDYLDDVSNTYRDVNSFDDPLARIMSDRSAEPTSARGDTRNLSNISISNGATGFNAAGFLGAGQEGAVRGNPDNDDMIFMTQLKFTYVIGGITRRRAKYR